MKNGQKNQNFDFSEGHNDASTKKSAEPHMHGNFKQPVSSIEPKTSGLGEYFPRKVKKNCKTVEKNLKFDIGQPYHFCEEKN